MRLTTTIGVDVIRRHRPAASRLCSSGPEPSTFKLLGITLIALGFARRRQIGGSVSQHHSGKRLPVWTRGDRH